MRGRPGFRHVALAAIGCVYLVHVRLLDARLQDDAFISFRYAKNLVLGHGLVHNPGERVEGYTNFLWTLACALPFVWSRDADPVAFARGLSIACGLATIVLTHRLARAVAPRAETAALAAPLLLAGSWCFAINSMTGLETVAFAMLLTLGTLLLVESPEGEHAAAASVVFGLAALTRPEATVLFALLASVVAAHRARMGSFGLWRPLRLLGPFAAIVAAHVSFRLGYYGALVPNTFVAKFGVPLPPSLPTRTAYLSGFVEHADLVLLFSSLGLLWIATTWRRLEALLVASGLAFGVANVALAGADFMIGYRYLVPYLPLLYVAGAGGAAVLVERRRRQGARATGFTIEALALGAALFASGTWLRHTTEVLRPFEELRRKIAEDTARPLGAWLAAHLPSTATLVTLDIGELGFVSGLRMRDLSGLTDPVTARAKGDLLDRDVDLDHVLGDRPEALVLISRSRMTGPLWERLRRSPSADGVRGSYWPPGSSRKLLADPRVRDGYVLAARYPDYERLVREPDGRVVRAPDDVPEGKTLPVTRFLELYLRRDVAGSVGH